MYRLGKGTVCPSPLLPWAGLHTKKKKKGSGEEGDSRTRRREVNERVKETGDHVMGEGRTAVNPSALLHGPLGSVYQSLKPRLSHKDHTSPCTHNPYRAS